MGTRSTITFIKKNQGKEVPVVKIYQQFDGYLTGVGQNLCTWILSKKVVNGYNFEHENGEYVNGFGCMVAQFIHDFKHGIGDLYVYPCTSKIDENCDYNYEVIYNGIDNPGGRRANDFITIRINNWGSDPFFEGSPLELLTYILEKGDNE